MTEQPESVEGRTDYEQRLTKVRDDVSKIVNDALAGESPYRVERQALLDLSESIKFDLECLQDAIRREIAFEAELSEGKS